MPNINLIYRLISSGIELLQGNNSSKLQSREFLLRVKFSINHTRYFSGFRLLDLAVISILYSIELAFAPFLETMKSQFLRPITNDLIDRSALYPNIRIIE